MVRVAVTDQNVNWIQSTLAPTGRQKTPIFVKIHEIHYISSLLGLWQCLNIIFEVRFTFPNFGLKIIGKLP